MQAQVFSFGTVEDAHLLHSFCFSPSFSSTFCLFSPDRSATSEGLPKRKALRQFFSFQETNTCFGSKGSISISVLNQFFKLSIVFPAAARPTSEGLPHSKSSFLKTNGFLFRKKETSFFTDYS